MPAASTTPRRLTHVNAFLSQLAVGRMSELNWTGPDGFAEDAVVTDPPNAQPGAKYPVVLLIHGGPGLSSSRDFVWEAWPLAQMIASHGYVVLQPNYRGSDNLGNAYMTAIVHNTVVGPSADILAGLDALDRRGGIDPSRAAVSGWSYGGELTSWLIGHDHRWRAAVSGAAVNSEFDEYNLATSNVQDRYPLGASPYTGDGQRIYRDNSPITYYAQITTPTLIWGTTQDPVVPITQSYALFHALTDNHVPVRFAVFPASTHGPADPRQTAELTRLWLGWLDAHLR
ncbi:MAG: prolyl oligopeptidase family serine peptidase [Candidatus Cybelea sp.]